MWRINGWLYLGLAFCQFALYLYWNGWVPFAH